MVPRSAAISWVSSSGKPYVSWRVKAVTPGQPVGAAGELGVEHRQAVAQGVPEPFLLVADHPDDEVALLGDVGIGVAHHVDGEIGERRHHQLLGAEEVGVAHRTADDPAQHVPAGLVAGEHAVADEHRRRAGVLGEHADGEAVAIVVDRPGV